ncbi:MAG: hypothetical protein ACPG6B_07510, partial [Oceanihabitans sp.]
NAIFSNSIKTDLAIYGSSRAWVDISPKILEDSLKISAYNFGIDGHNFWLQYYRHQAYLKNNPKPKHIILAVDFNSLQKREELYLSEQFLPYMLWNKDLYTYTKSYTGFNNVAYYIPLIRYIGKTAVLEKSFNNLNKKPTPYRSNGYKGVEKNWSNALAKAKLKLDNYTIEYDKPTIALFEKFLTECSKKNIAVTMVYTPEHIEGQEFIKDRQKLINTFQWYSKKFNIPFLDYSKDSICYQKKYFYNAMHLNKKGSEKFTKILASDLKNRSTP